MAIDLEEAEKRITALEKCQNDLLAAVNKLVGSANTVELLLKWVVLPLLVILGALIGVKIAMPTL